MYRNNIKMSRKWLIATKAELLWRDASAAKLWLCCVRNLMIEWRRTDRGVHLRHDDLPLIVSESATKFFKEKVLGTDNSECCFRGAGSLLGEVKES